MPEPKPKSISVLSVSTTNNLSNKFGEIIESLVLQEIVKVSDTRVVNCQECKVPRVKIKGDKLIVTKGVPDYKTQIEIAKELEVEAFLKLELVKTFFTMQLNVTAMHTGNQTVFASKNFKVSNITIGDSSLQIAFGGGVNLDITPAYKLAWNESLPYALELSFLENIGSVSKAA